MTALPTAFRAIRVHAEGKTFSARFEQLSIDDLSAGEVIIRVVYSSLNYKDALAVTGSSRILKTMPRVPGIDLSGYVVRSTDARFAAGEPVLVTGCNIGEVLDGGLAEYARLPAETLVKLPKGLSLREAMALGTAGFTAALALRRMLENHQTPDMGSILVTGATGGVGSVAVQLFKKQGFHVSALTGKPDTAREYLSALGADALIDRSTLTMGNKPLETGLWGGAVDNLGGETLAWLTRTVKPWGNIASIGLAQSHELHSTVMPLILRGVSLLGIHSVECPRAWREDIWQHLASDWKPDALDVLAPRTLTLDQVPAACADLIRGTSIGRSVVQLSAE